MASTDGWTYTGPGTGYLPNYGSASPPTFDWRQGAWQVANKWVPTWAAANPWQSLKDTGKLVDALNAVTPDRSAANYAQYAKDLAYAEQGAANVGMPSWYNIQQPWGITPQVSTPSPAVNYTPQYAPTFDWSQWGGQTAVNPIQQFSGTPSWMNDPNWVLQPEAITQAEKWAAVMVPWAQTQQNAYQYANDANEAQRRYNLDAAWRQAQDQFTMDQAKQTADYQKVRDAEEFALGRQQIWGRNQVPNTKWQRNWQ